MAAKKPNDGPPKSRRLPSGWPSPTATSTPHSPGGPQDAERDRVDGRDAERAGLVRGVGECLQVLDRAEEVRVLDEEGGRLVVEGGGELARRR